MKINFIITMCLKIFSVKSICIILLTLIIGMSFSFTSREKYTHIPKHLIQYIDGFNNAVLKLDNAAEDYRFERISTEALQKAVTNARLSYKKAEFFLAFYYPEYISEHINGAPLLHIDRSNTRPLVLPPEGLQVLDELAFAKTITQEQKSEIASLAKKLRSHYNTLYITLAARLKTDTNTIAAMRLQLVRLFTMGITGFDTPGSLHAIPETKTSLEAMRNVFTEVDKDKDIILLFDAAIAYLNTPVSFNDFDRLTFIREYLDPLYSRLGRLQNNTDSDYIKNTTAWNSSSTSVFAGDFLNPYYFTNLTKRENSEELKALGRDLFYDPVLSSDNAMSCASCHNPEKAFTDGAVKSASSIKDKTVLRNAPTLLNAVYADRYFYDLRAFTLEQQAEHVIFNTDEFNTAYIAILQKLKADKKYTENFRKIFGKDGITRENFSKALASYVMSLTSFNSPFDKYIRRETSIIDASVKNGFNLFMGKANCATCHFAPTFSGLVPPGYTENESEILGILQNPNAKQPVQDTDEGRLNSPLLSERAWIYEKSFKTTTVRNAALTAPYFHNGAYKTLEEVIEFYNRGGGAGHGLTVINQTLPGDKLNLTESEKKDLIAFISSLNDTSAANRP